MATLIIDSRENNITRHSAELANTPIVRRMITVGDYAIIDNTGRVLISIERKSLEDYAASIKDGRITNIMKMVELREKTGCRLVLLVEGRPGAKHGGIPWKAIESSMWHIAFRHQVVLLFTKSTIETAELMARLVLSINNMQNGHSPMMPAVPAALDAPVGIVSTGDVSGGASSAQIPDMDSAAKPTAGNTAAKPTAGNTAAQQTAQDAPAPPVPDALTATRQRTTHETARAIMAVIRGITVDSADDYLAKFSPMDIIRGSDVRGMKLSSGKVPTKLVIAGVNKARVDPATWTNMLMRIPGITKDSAAGLLRHATLPTLLTWSAESIGIITVSTKTGRNGLPGQKKLPGPTVARMLDAFKFKLTVE